MAHELEAKVLDVDKDEIAAQLDKLGAKKISEGRLVVDWFGPKGLTHNGDDPWFLRIRSYSGGKHEVTWKGLSDVLGASRKHPEINLSVTDPENLAAMFMKLDLEKYGHQEKDRTSWTYKDLKFDLDQYPGMPAYLEIEASSEERIQEAIRMLGLESSKTSSEGERALIQNQYGLNWFDMRF